MFFYLAVGFLTISCSGIKIKNNCKSGIKQTVAVLPFLNDEFDCNKNIEKFLENRCYQIVDGRMLLNEYSIATNKKFDDITLEEFTVFAKNRGVDLIVFGSVHIEWHTPSVVLTGGRYGEEDILARHLRTGRGEGRAMSDGLVMQQLLKGNYVVIDAFAIDTKTKEKITVYSNHKLKKVNTGQPSFVRQ